MLHSMTCTIRVLLCCLLLSASSLLFGQASTSAGSIDGTITDPSGAVAVNVAVQVSSPATGFHQQVVTSSTGQYNLGSLRPGEYLVLVKASGFSEVQKRVIVNVGVISNGDIRLSVSNAKESITVAESEIAVDTAQATVQGVLDRQEISEMPVNGRNFLDVAQLQPGVQIQDGGTFDPTKNGFSSLSIGGRFGRTARIELDGLDISDETVGTTTQNISQDAIQEFQLAQSSLDLSTSLTSSGAVNVSTRSGTNQLHGGAFYNFRDARAGGAAINGASNYQQRNNPGGTLGGTLKKDKVFFFLSAERTRQALFEQIMPSGDLAATAGGYMAPFSDNELLGRLDFNLPHGIRAFYRTTYNHNSIVAENGSNYSPFLSRNNTPGHGGGIDFSHGRLTHSIRLGYFKMVNTVGDASEGIYDPAPGLTLNIGDFSSGPSPLAPQETIQTNKQFKYDGSWAVSRHLIRFGGGVNRLMSNGRAQASGLAPTILGYQDSESVAFANAGPYPGGSGNPLNYGVGFSNGGVTSGITLGNGQGNWSETPSFGFPHSGQFDTRLTAYLGDSWKVLPNLTLSYGLRYIRDTGRSDADLPAIPLLNEVEAGLGNRVAQPNMNFGPQVGFAWDPRKNGKTVIRGGVGLYYENNIWNNNWNARPARLATGLYAGSQTICPSGTVQLPGSGGISSIDGLDIATQICGQHIGQVRQALIDLQAAYQSAVAAGQQYNNGYVGNTLAEGPVSTYLTPFAPDYKTPVSYQFNLGMQRELRPGVVLTLDYVRNVNIHTLLGIDKNRVGDARYLNVSAAQNAIATTAASLGCGNSYAQSAIDCAIENGANIASFAANGLDSEDTGNSGFPSGGAWAFGGRNTKFGQMVFLEPAGRSVYNSLQLSLRGHLEHPARGVKMIDGTFSYALSRTVSTAQDSDYAMQAIDNNSPERFIGPNALDRKQQFSIGLNTEFAGKVHVSTIAHFYSPLPLTITLPSQGAGDIFVNDVTGDGTTGDILPGTRIGSFMRDVQPGGLNKLFASYNQNYGGKLTPAGKALVAAGLFSSAQLTALGAVMPVFGTAPNANVQSLAYAPQGQVGMDWLRTFDLRFSRPIALGEKLKLEPTVSIFNVLNFANFDSPNLALSGSLQGTAGYINGTRYADQSAVRTGLGSGVYAFGAPRQFEFGMRLSF